MRSRSNLWMPASFVLCAGLALVFITGCGKKKEDVVVIEVPAEEQSQEAPRSVKTEPAYEAPGQPVVQEAVNVGKPLPVSFRVGAIIERGNGELFAGLVSDESGYNDMVEVGDDFEGYTVTEINGAASEVLLTRNGQNYIAGMTAGTVGDVSKDNIRYETPAVAPETAEEFEALMKASRTEYKATPDEISRGIDPNDPKTWTEDYRGPGIERAGVDVEKFEPTADEIERGIDPNDAKTWPQGYRGPGIERAMLEMQKK